jgi:PIN domain nuclease of toxin-antitoxin system
VRTGATLVDEAVLDASALLALVHQEPGWREVGAVGSRIVSSVNLAEAGSVLANEGYSQPELEATFAALRFRVVDFDYLQALEVARLRPLTRAHGLSLGDRACLALGRLRALPILTADSSWKAAAPDLAIVQIR